MLHLKLYLYLQCLTMKYIFTSQQDSIPTPPILPPAVPEDHLLLRMQPGARACYLQYGPPIPSLRVFNPVIFDSITPEDYSACICEHWWASEDDPTQLMLYNGEENMDWTMGHNKINCLWGHPGNIIGCQSFDDCVAAMKFPKQQPSAANSAVLRCTVGMTSLTDPSKMPLYPIQVSRISNFDIGNRCDRRAIQQMLNNRLELYRKNSQFFWQIPVFDINELVQFCDKRIDESGATVRIHFKCLDNIPEPESRDHLKPLSRGKAETIKSPPVGFKCYELAGDPWPGILIQGLSASLDFKITLEDPLCLCEDKGVATVKPMEECSQGISVIPCSDINNICSMELEFLSNKNYSIFCSSVYEDLPSSKEPKNLGNRYFPNYVASVYGVNIQHKEGLDFDYTKQMSFCWHNQTLIIRRRPEYKEYTGEEETDRRLFNDRLKAYETEQEDVARKMRHIWANWINERTQYQRYNADIHLHVLLNNNEFVHYFCPELPSDMIRADEFPDHPEADTFAIQLEIKCKYLPPYNLP